MLFARKMQNLRIIVQTPSILRNFCTTSTVCANYTVREGKFLQKFVHGRTKRKHYHVKEVVPSSTLGGKTKRLPSTHVLRRMTVLNKLFMESITDLMSTGAASADIINRNIEITDVKVTADFKVVNVLYINNDPIPDVRAPSTEEILKKCAMSLRHELSQLRVISVVPLIQFVKCKRHLKEKTVERLLLEADYGEGFQPSLYPYSPNTTMSHVAENIENLQAQENIETKNCKKKVQGTVNTDDIFFVTLPIMRHDVFGVDHYKIMTEIKVSLEKSRNAIQRRLSNAQLQSNTSDKLELENSPNFESQKVGNNEFADFLIHRRREELIKHRKISKRQQERMLAINEEAHATNNDTDDLDEYCTSSDEDFDDFEDENL